MTLDEAIQHCEEVATIKDKQIANGDWEKGSLTEHNCIECASEHRQLAEWLKDYKRLKEQKPCEDAVSRRAVLELVADYDLNMGQVVKGIHSLPSVIPQPKMGRWIYDKNIENWRCSECGETPKTRGYCGSANFMEEHFKYCNHCGAKMIEPQESEKK